MAHARDFQDRHNRRIILAGVEDYRFCPRCGGPLELRLLKAGEPERLVCTRVRVRVLPRSENRRRHDHPHGLRRHRARTPGHRSRLWKMGVPWRLRRSGRTADGRGRPAKRVKNAAWTFASTGSSTSTPTPVARRSLSSMRQQPSAASCRSMMSVWKRLSSRPTVCRGIISPSVALTTACVTIWLDFCTLFPGRPAFLGKLKKSRTGVNNSVRSPTIS